MAKLEYFIISINHPSEEALKKLVHERYEPITVTFSTDKIYGRTATYIFEVTENTANKQFINVKIPCPQNDMTLETDEVIEMIISDMAEVLI